MFRGSLYISMGHNFGLFERKAQPGLGALPAPLVALQDVAPLQPGLAVEARDGTVQVRARTLRPLALLELRAEAQRLHPRR